MKAEMKAEMKSGQEEMTVEMKAVKMELAAVKATVNELLELLRPKGAVIGVTRTPKGILAA